MHAVLVLLAREHLYTRRNRISHRSRRASQLTDESLTSRAFGAARRCKSPIASPDIQDPIGSDRDVDDAGDRRPTTRHPDSPTYLPSLSLPLDTPAFSHSCMHRKRIELFRFSACQRSPNLSLSLCLPLPPPGSHSFVARPGKLPTIKRDSRTRLPLLQRLQSRRR